MSEQKEWVGVKHSPTGTTATVTLQEGNLTVKWTVKTYPSLLKGGVAAARRGAQEALGELAES